MSTAEAFNRSWFSRFINSSAGRVFRLVVGTGLLIVGYLFREQTLGVIAMVFSVLPLSAGVCDLGRPIVRSKDPRVAAASVAPRTHYLLLIFLFGIFNEPRRDLTRFFRKSGFSLDKRIIDVPLSTSLVSRLVFD
jgi:hypothetical protein